MSSFFDNFLLKYIRKTKCKIGKASKTLSCEKTDNKMLVKLKPGKPTIINMIKQGRTNEPPPLT
jgi:hypothetical protein